MPVGKNINLEDKIIKKTTGKTSNKRNVSNTNIKRKPGMPSLDPGKETFKTKKMTFYINPDLFNGLKNFAYWERHSLTKAFNIVMSDGLKGKNIKQKT